MIRWRRHATSPATSAVDIFCFILTTCPPNRRSCVRAATIQHRHAVYRISVRSYANESSHAKVSSSQEVLGPASCPEFLHFATRPFTSGGTIQKLSQTLDCDDCCGVPYLRCPVYACAWPRGACGWPYRHSTSIRLNQVRTGWYVMQAQMEELNPHEAIRHSNLRYLCRTR